jgi:DNA-binding GntR family transcriptional regulator
LRQSVANLLAAARAGDREGYACHDLDLHRAIVSASGNRTLLAIWESLAFETKPRLSLARRQLDLVTLAAWHETVIDALEAGDGETAGRLLSTLRSSSRTNSTSFTRKRRRADASCH